MIDQIGIALTGVTAIFLTQSKREWLRKYACLFGMAGQPFWIYAAWTAEQWGILALTSLYTFAWAKGVWTHWVRPTTPPVDPLSKSGYAMSESKTNRLILGFETLDDLQDAHEHVARLARREHT